MLASKGFHGREKVVHAMERYFTAKGQDCGSDLVQVRYKILSQQFDLQDIARFECVNGIALLLNTVPAAFWTIYHVFSDRKLLRTVREEALSLSTSWGKDGTTTGKIDLAIQKDMSLLTAILHESLRYRGSGIGPRFVMEDTMLNDFYLLRKGAFVIIPQRHLNFNQSAWGGSANIFDPARFLKNGSNPKLHPGAFRGWGGGANLCAGKRFATKVIDALLAIMTISYEMTSASGDWEEPGQDLSNISLAIGPPKRKVRVNLTPRTEACQRRGTFGVSKREQSSRGGHARPESMLVINDSKLSSQTNSMTRHVFLLLHGPDQDRIRGQPKIQ
ncbi:MAG: hypothetical protein Q9172_002795 [Xanthocarpia lactea]